MDEGETLGKYLKQQRESKKISLREVAKSTKVRETILKAIEEDQHHLLPPTTYVKGFLLSYAKYLRLNPNDVLLRYERALKGEPITSPPLPPHKPEQEVPPPPPPKPKVEVSPLPPPKTKQEISLPQPPKPKKKILWNAKQIWVVGGVILVSLIVFYFFSPYPSTPPIEPIPQKPVVEDKPSLVPSPPAPVTTSLPEEKPVVEDKQTPTPSPPAKATISVPGAPPFSLQLKAVEETWVSVQVDDQLGKEMTFKPGEGISLQASKRIRILIGNGGGLDLIWNGKPLERFGKSGEVVTLVMTSQGVEVKRPEKANSP
jgi:cytoskeleton protein RodZ